MCITYVRWKITCFEYVGLIRDVIGNIDADSGVEGSEDPNGTTKTTTHTADGDGSMKTMMHTINATLKDFIKEEGASFDSDDVFVGNVQ